MQARMGQWRETREEPLLLTGMNESLQIQKRNTVRGKLLIGNAAGESGIFLKRGTVTLEQINGMNPVAANQKKDRFGECTVPGIILLIMIVKEKTGVFDRLKFCKKSRQLRIAGIQIKIFCVIGKIIVVGDVVPRIVIVHFTVRIVCNDGTSRGTSPAGKEEACLNAKIGKIGVESCFVAVKAVNLKTADFCGHNWVMARSVNIHISLSPMKKSFR